MIFLFTFIFTTENSQTRTFIISSSNVRCALCWISSEQNQFRIPKSNSDVLVLNCWHPLIIFYISLIAANFVCIVYVWFYGWFIRCDGYQFYYCYSTASASSNASTETSTIEYNRIESKERERERERKRKQWATAKLIENHKNRICSGKSQLMNIPIFIQCIFVFAVCCVLCELLCLLPFPFLINLVE